MTKQQLWTKKMYLFGKSPDCDDTERMILMTYLEAFKKI